MCLSLLVTYDRYWSFHVFKFVAEIFFHLELSNNHSLIVLLIEKTRVSGENSSTCHKSLTSLNT
jgi:hypothetical protein